MISIDIKAYFDQILDRIFFLGNIIFWVSKTISQEVKCHWMCEEANLYGKLFVCQFYDLLSGHILSLAIQLWNFKPKLICKLSDKKLLQTWTKILTIYANQHILQFWMQKIIHFQKYNTPLCNVHVRSTGAPLLDFYANLMSK